MRKLPQICLIGLATVAMVFVMGCKSSGSAATTSSSTTSSGGGSGGTTSGLTAAELAAGGYNGSGVFEASCQAISGNSMGTSLAGYSTLKVVTFNSGGTYSLSTLFFDSNNCTGSEGLVYSQGGTFTVGSSDTTVTSAYDISYTATSAQLTLYTGAWGTVFNGSNCAGQFGGAFSTNGESTSVNTTISGVNCSTNGLSISFPTLTTFYDLINPNSLSSPSNFYAYQANSVFMMGQYSSTPTTDTDYFNN